MHVRLSQPIPAGFFFGFIAACAAILAVIPVTTHSYVAAQKNYLPHEIDAAKDSIALSLMGQLQLSMGDLMWLKSMEYLHLGMVQRIPTQGEERAGFIAHESASAPTGLSHTEGVQMVLDKERDWRGWFGELERQVKPYDTAHKHDDPVELIPWYELAVKLNPGLERLYTLGAFYLADFAQEPAEAREMLEAGVKANPNSFEINGALGRLYVDFADNLPLLVHEGEEDDLKAKTPEEAYTFAVEHLRNAIENALQKRLAMAERREVFDDTQNQVFGESYLYLSKALAALGQYEEAKAIAAEGFETATKYQQRNLLRAQERSVDRLMQPIGTNVQDASVAQ